KVRHGTRAVVNGPLVHVIIQAVPAPLPEPTAGHDATSRANRSPRHHAKPCAPLPPNRHLRPLSGPPRPFRRHPGSSLKNLRQHRLADNDHASVPFRTFVRADARREGPSVPLPRFRRPGLAVLGAALAALTAAAPAPADAASTAKPAAAALPAPTNTPTG